MSTVATDLFGAALGAVEDVPATPDEWFVRYDDGRRVALTTALGRWSGQVDRADAALLDRATGCVLDVGCGPGRLVAALARRGQHALGVDITAAAVHLAKAAGGVVVQRSVFDRLPGEGRWDSLLLADGNIGIGGDPPALLRRCRELVTPRGHVLVELERPGTGRSTARVRLEHGSRVSTWFGWAHVGVDGIGGPAAEAGLRVRERWSTGDRWFAALDAGAPSGTPTPREAP